MPELNPILAEALDRVRTGTRVADLEAAASEISAHYRARGRSRAVIDGSDAALAYALTRLPATHAAVSAVLAELSARAPDFAPDSLLDAGAGPGTAAWAALDAFPVLGQVTLFDHNPAFLDLAARLAADAPEPLKSAARVRGDLARPDAPPADLVIAAYALTELPEAALVPAARALWARAKVLVLVEPGRPADHARLMAIKAALGRDGAMTLAPCPHDAPCPLAVPDWCHFSARLSRSRTHRQLKGGTLGYEDEKYSYLILARPGIGRRAAARVIKPADRHKPGIGLALCEPTGLNAVTVLKRDQDRFRQARSLNWGDAAPTGLADETVTNRAGLKPRAGEDPR